MSAYLPSEPWVVAVLSVLIVIVLGAGHALSHRGSPRLARLSAWSTLVLGTLTVEKLVLHEPSGVRMVALIVFALVVMKVIVVVEERARGMEPLGFGNWLAFAGAWLGMNPRLFTTRESSAIIGAAALIRRGAANAFVGATLLVLAKCAWAVTHDRRLATLLALPALSLLVHFGLCNLLAGAWRLRGVACSPLFRAPLRAQNLSEFWGRRWNLAFSEMARIAVYRPLAPRLGPWPALIAAFALSGLLHEMAISVPVRAGFGLPLLYFIVHGGLVLLERALSKAGHPLAGRFGRVWTFFWLAAPLPILFHEPFLAGVIWPLIGIPDQ